jgi:bacteriocin biosynthesis cyclodehydratase domain-containing protein
MRASSALSLPYLAPWYRIAKTDRAIVLEHGQRIVTLEGKAVERLLPCLLPLLDGRRTVDEIVELLGRPARPAVEHALRLLDDHGVLEQGPPLPEDLPRPQVGAAELLASLRPGVRPPAATADALAACSVAVAGEGGTAVELVRLLRTAGMVVERAEDVAGGVDLTVCAPSPAERRRLSEWNAQALEARAPWLQLIGFDGRYAAIGPLFLPNDTCCYECFRLRRRANLEGGADLSVTDDVPGDYPASPALDAAVAGLAALLVSGWLVDHDHHTPGTLFALALLPTPSLDAHHVYRVPRCSACSGVAGRAAPLPWYKEVVHAGDGR